MAEQDYTRANWGGFTMRGVTDASGKLSPEQVMAFRSASAQQVGVSLANPLPTREPGVSSVTISELLSATTSTQLLAANTNRKGLILYNTDNNDVFVKYGATASAQSFTVKIPADGYWEMPTPIYTGRIDAIWAADGSGALYATELS